jgi:pyruvate/2-oxoglutarate dehydrogenase complex dihydrolipoamide dehydrogenase (E3) component
MSRRRSHTRSLRFTEGLWAIGDVTGQATLMHVALYQGAIAVADILDRPLPPGERRGGRTRRVHRSRGRSGGHNRGEAKAAGVDVAVATKQSPTRRVVTA